MGSKSDESSNNRELVLQGSQYGSLDVSLDTIATRDRQQSTTQSLPPKPAVRQRTALKQQQQQESKLNDNYSNSLPLPSSNSIHQQKQREAFRRELEKKLIEKELNQARKSMNNSAINNQDDNNNKNNNININNVVVLEEKNQNKLMPTFTSQKKEEEVVKQLEQQQINIPAKNDQSNLNKNLTPKPEASETNRPYPKKVLFIIANEFCERFSYYGLRTVLVLYLKQVLGFSDSNSTVSFHLFATLCYLTPILGAILGDSVWGKYDTIVYLSIVYFFGELFLFVSSVFWDQGLITISYTFIGLFMIGVGTGGIKPCVGALGGDQFMPNEERWRQGFFSLFYATINAGSLLSMFLTPMLRSQFKCVNRQDCYPYAFALPCLLMFLAIVIFVSAKNRYHLVPLPERNVIVAFCQCVWLALKRKFSKKFINKVNDSESSFKKLSLTNQSLTTNKKLSSTLSMNSNGADSSSDSVVVDDENKIVVEGKSNYISKHSSSVALIETSDQRIDNKRPNNNHWLYLSSDRFDSKTIDEFKSVLDILLLAIPLPVYWCLFDQQSSLWTLQASRMDGRVFNTNFILQPDQLSVANPLLLLLSIPAFELFIYPSLERCDLLRKPLQRMTVGGLLAALTFVLSSLIELRIQEYLPPVTPISGESNLIIVNGLSECFIVNPMISTNIPPIALVNELKYNNNTSNNNNDTILFDNFTNILKQLESQQIETIPPLSTNSVNVISAKEKALSNYQLKFKLSSTLDNGGVGHSSYDDHHQIIGNCPFNSNELHKLNIDPLKDKSVKFLYLEQGNGKLNYKLFNESLDLPDIGKARVKLIYESFGSSLQAGKRTFYLVRLDSSTTTSSANNNDNNNYKNNNTTDNNSSKNSIDDQNNLTFKTSIRDGQVSISDQLDVVVSANGDLFQLKTSDPNLKISFSQNNNNTNIFIEPGTRSLLVAHQKNATHIEINYQILQDNKYRISMLYQLVPYLLISMSEVMFSITGLQFSYAMAPDNMKSLILGAWSLSTAFGNILTVAVESLHLFSNIAYDFLFYATLMAIDMVLFAMLAYYYRPYTGNKQQATNGLINNQQSTSNVA